jgi:hypothetical protein
MSFLEVPGSSMMEYSRTFQEALEYSLTLDMSDQEGGNNLPYKGKRNGTLTATRIIGSMGTIAVHTLRLIMLALRPCFVGAFIARVVIGLVFKRANGTSRGRGASGSAVLETLAVSTLTYLHP